MLYTVPPDLGQLHQMFDTGARPALAATAAIGRRSGSCWWSWGRGAAIRRGEGSAGRARDRDGGRRALRRHPPEPAQTRSGATGSAGWPALWTARSGRGGQAKPCGPAPSRRSCAAIWCSRGWSTPGHRRGPAGSQLFHFVPVLTSFRRRARCPKPQADLARRHQASSARSSRGSRGAPDPVRSLSERSPGFPSPPSAPPHEVPGFGGHLLPRSVRVLYRGAGGAGDLPLGSPSRSPVANLPWPSGTCSLRTSGSPRLLLLSRPILRGPSPQSVPIHSPSSSRPCLGEGEPPEKRPSWGEKAWSRWELSGNRSGTAVAGPGRSRQRKSCDATHIEPQTEPGSGRPPNRDPFRGIPDRPPSRPDPPDPRAVIQLEAPNQQTTF
jgi:hypothetical protein